MDKLKQTILFIITILGTISCGQGFITTNPPPQQTYALATYSASYPHRVGCNLYVYPFTCSKSSSYLVIDVTWASSNPAAFYQIPLQNTLPTGVSVTGSSGCNNQNGGAYTCEITISGSDVVSGTNINIPLNGSMGIQQAFSITFE